MDGGNGTIKHHTGPHRTAKDLQKDRKGPPKTTKDRTGPQRFFVTSLTTRKRSQ